MNIILKNITKLALILIFILSFIVINTENSYSQLYKKSLSENLPEKTYFYLSFNNPQELANKINYDKVREAMFKMSYEKPEDVKEIFKRDITLLSELKAIGIDLNKPGGFAIHRLRNELFSITVSLYDSVKFSEYLEEFISLNKFKAEKSIVNGKNLYILYQNQESNSPILGINYSNDRASVIFADYGLKVDDIKDHARSIDRKKLFDKQEFKKLQFHAKNYDIETYIDIEAFNRIYGPNAYSDMKLFLKAIEDFQQLIGGITIDNDRVELSYFSNVSNDSLYWSDLAKNRVTPQSLTAYDDVPVALLRSSFDWKNYYKAFKKKIAINKYAKRDIDRFEKEFQEHFDLSFDSVLDALSGDINAALFNIPDSIGSGSDISFIHKISNKLTITTLWEKIMKLLKEEEGVEFTKENYKGEDLYSTMLIIINPAISITSDYIIAATSGKRTKSIIDKMMNRSGNFINKIQNAEIRNTLQNSDNVLWVNIKKLMKQVMDNFPQQEVKIANDILSPIHHAYISASEDRNNLMMSGQFVIIGEDELIRKVFRKAKQYMY